MNYGAAPIVVDSIFVPDCELVFALYLLVRLAGTPLVVIPPNLKGYGALVDAAIAYEGAAADGQHVYLTVKRLWVEPGCLGGRLGWHTDGFGTADVNYIWADADPTEFCVQSFDLSDDHTLSMAQMAEQAQAANIVRFKPLDLIRIDARHVHRCPENPTPGFRTFARVSFSRDRYDMIGNAHNYGLDYNWVMHPRGAVRNDTATRDSRQRPEGRKAEGFECEASQSGGEAASPKASSHPDILDEIGRLQS